MDSVPWFASFWPVKPFERCLAVEGKWKTNRGHAGSNGAVRRGDLMQNPESTVSKMKQYGLDNIRTEELVGHLF